ncbi:hypothetical protein SEVIR_7G274900v4 [Setaria viridis]|uniref:Uncharacterized protein n=2 Tax=Setaria TaxID=4554 RepID=A0A368S075_SETIT|nr:uncharacterized protein LOC101774665 [Setaria italica]XP_034602521.1 uncharacterized protein LOC117863051 [Setaria viridis]RCV35734.1 hypothetical protein SETIT_7G263500v2 [Setaria italica]TKW06957.1 hypothetical protein SEVIR_7G274900v2 [Setaria viridis]
MAVHVLLLAVPAVAGGFLQAFQFTFLLWPFNLALPLARHLPRACAVLRELASFYDAELRPYASGARRAVRRPPTPPRTRSQRRALLRDELQRAAHEDIVANAMIALVDISY